MKQKTMIYMLALVLLVSTSCSKIENNNTSITTEADILTSTAESSTKEAGEQPQTTSKSNQNVDANVEIDQQVSVLVKTDYLVEHVDEYVGLLDYREIKLFSDLKLELKDDNRPQKHTGNIKKRYRNNERKHIIRIPYLKEKSELANSVNEEIKELFDNIDMTNLLYQEIDFDAYLINNILSIRITRQSAYDSYINLAKNKLNKELLKTYNFDISSGKLIKLTDAELFERLNTDKDTVKQFAENYLISTLPHFYSYQVSYDVIELDIEKALEQFEDNYNNNNLKIYKSPRNDYFTLELDTAFWSNHGYPFTIDFTIASSESEMAMLSAPAGAIGVIYKTYDEECTLPPTSSGNIKTTLRTLNEKGDGMPIYFTSFSNTSYPVEICDIKFTEVEYADETIFVKELLPTDITIDKPMPGDIYKYHTVLPEAIPFEAICMEGPMIHTIDYSMAAVQETIYDDMHCGNKIQYLFTNYLIGKYYWFEESGTTELFCEINFKPDRQFETKNWEKIGIPIKNGTYSADDNYVYLFPCEKDIENGASSFYILEKNLDNYSIKPIYGEGIGELETFMDFYTYFESFPESYY